MKLKFISLIVITLALTSPIIDKCELEIQFKQMYENYHLLSNLSFSNVWQCLKSLFHYSLIVVPVYVFFQRVHSQNQHRALKSISDEIIKINDFVIEFILKVKYLNDSSSDLEQKDIYELETLKAKINAHLHYLGEFFKAFPYGGPINYFLLVITKKLHFPKASLLTDKYEYEYQELILNDTILSLEIEFIENKKFKALDEMIIPLNQKTIDGITVLSRNILEHLERNTRKIF